MTLAGHGANLDDSDDFFFLPFDYNDTKRESTGVYWDDFKRHFRSLPCRVLLVVDACHSGTITTHLRGVDEEKEVMKRGARQVSQGSGKGMIVMAACLGSAKAQERKAWGHGALSLALIEGVSGQHLYKAKTATVLKSQGPEKVITLKALDNYITDRVAEIAGNDQAVVTNQTGDIALIRIPISTVGSEIRK